MKFAHITDCHLGGWRQPEIQQLNFDSFKQAIDISIEENVDFILFTGDLFDSAFPPIEVLKDTFAEFKKLKDAKIKSFVIAGSHDYSVSGKTFLDVLEKAGFCEIPRYEETTNEIILKPSKYQTYNIYGYPGKKSGLEISSLKKIKILEPYSSNFRILMLHTTLTEVIDNIPIESISLSELPKADYYALGHVHTDFEHEHNGKPVIYGGPTFPNNFKELEELKHGCFYVIEVNGITKVTKKEIKLKQPILIEIEISDALTATQTIISEIKKHNINDKIVLLRVFGQIIKGKTSDINFQEIQKHIENSKAYSFIKNTSKLETAKQEMHIELRQKEKDQIEEILIKKFKNENPSEYNKLIFTLMSTLSLEKQEGENNLVFEKRLFSELNKVLGVELG